MANSNPTKTTLKPGDNLPARGRSNKTIILEAIRESSMLDLTDDSTKDDAEKAFFKHVATSAFNPEDKDRGMCLKLLSDKGWASLKPTSNMIEFDFDVDAEPHVQGAQILKGMADGKIPPDLAGVLIQSIKAMVDIEEFTNLKSRILALEKLIE